MKRVACLYRVSIKKQVTENDLPMQKNACKKFIEKMEGWELTKEYMEKGVSGYHKSAAQRDVLQAVKIDAGKGNFDILLVFMFDRLGRREDETPFIVEWFVEQGIEVWSVTEGQQKFENRVDKLMNYIRFWQSGGESQKTSMRVSEKHKQMVEEGIFRGGSPPFGYMLVKSGQTNNKGYELKKLVIDPNEGEVVVKIFNLAVSYGYGCLKIAQYLNDSNITNKRGNTWTAKAIHLLLNNELYKGRYVSGKKKSERGEKRITEPEHWIYCNEILQDLMIVDEKTWDKAQDIRTKRNTENSDCALPTNSVLLFSGYAKCGYCHSKMGVKYVTRTQAEGKKVFVKYHCKSRREMKCNGQSTYSIDKIEPVILAEIDAYLNQLQEVDLTPKIKFLQNDIRQVSEVELQQVKQTVVKIQSELTILNDEILKCITGESKFTSEQLSKLIAKKESDYKQAITEEQYISEDLRVKLKKTNNIRDFQKLIPNWKHEFKLAPLEVQKMLLAQVIDEVFIFKDKITIQFKYDILDLKENYYESTEKDKLPIQGEYQETVI